MKVGAVVCHGSEGVGWGGVEKGAVEHRGRNGVILALQACVYALVSLPGSQVSYKGSRTMRGRTRVSSEREEGTGVVSFSGALRLFLGAETTGFFVILSLSMSDHCAGTPGPKVGVRMLGTPAEAVKAMEASGRKSLNSAKRSGASLKRSCTWAYTWD